MYKSDDDNFDPPETQGVCTPFTEEDTKRFNEYKAYWAKCLAEKEANK
jgi:hypothetical protein